MTPPTHLPQRDARRIPGRENEHARTDGAGLMGGILLSMLAKAAETLCPALPKAGRVVETFQARRSATLSLRDLLAKHTQDATDDLILWERA